VRFEVHDALEDEPSVAGRISAPCCPERCNSVSRHDDSCVRAFSVERSVRSHRCAVRSETHYVSACKRSCKPRSRCLKSRHSSHSGNGLHRGRTRDGPNVLSKHYFSFVVRFAVCEPPNAESTRVVLPNPCATLITRRIAPRPPGAIAALCTAGVCSESTVSEFALGWRGFRPRQGRTNRPPSTHSLNPTAPPPTRRPATHARQHDSSLKHQGYGDPPQKERAAPRSSSRRSGLRHLESLQA